MASTSLQSPPGRGKHRGSPALIWWKIPLPFIFIFRFGSVCAFHLGCPTPIGRGGGCCIPIGGGGGSSTPIGGGCVCSTPIGGGCACCNPIVGGCGLTRSPPLGLRVGHMEQVGEVQKTRLAGRDYPPSTTTPPAPVPAAGAATAAALDCLRVLYRCSAARRTLAVAPQVEFECKVLYWCITC